MNSMNCSDSHVVPSSTVVIATARTQLNSALLHCTRLLCHSNCVMNGGGKGTNRVGYSFDSFLSEKLTVQRVHCLHFLLLRSRQVNPCEIQYCIFIAVAAAVYSWRREEQQTHRFNVIIIHLCPSNLSVNKS